jgi:hypothetical protein
VIQASKETQIFAPGKAGVKAEIAAGVVADLAANGAGIENGIVSRDLRVAVGGKKQRGENLEQRGFAGAVSAQKNQRFAGAYFEGNSGERYDGRFFKWLEKGAPAAARGRKRFLESCDVNRGFRHDETYSVSVARRQSAARTQRRRARF